MLPSLGFRGGCFDRSGVEGNTSRRGTTDIIMSVEKEFADVSGKYGAGPRCIHCHESRHDEETGPNCDIIQLRAQIEIMNQRVQVDAKAYERDQYLIKQLRAQLREKNEALGGLDSDER